MKLTSQLRNLKTENSLVYAIINLLTVAEARVDIDRDVTQVLENAAKEKKYLPEQTQAITNIFKEIKLLGKAICDYQNIAASEKTRSQAQTIGQLTSSAKMFHQLQDQPDASTIQSRTREILECLSNNNESSGINFIARAVNASFPGIEQEKLNSVIANLTTAVQAFQKTLPAPLESWTQPEETSAYVQPGKSYANAVDPEADKAIPAPARGNCLIM